MVNVMRKPPSSPPVIISMTTIPSRMHRIYPVLESLTRQTALIDSVKLWIPKTYRRSGLAEFDLPQVPKGVEICRADYDYGPATKVFPCVLENIAQAPDLSILYCDDDRIYDPGWAQRLLDAGRLHPDCCIAEAGNFAHLVLASEFKTKLPFKLLRFLTLNASKLVFNGILRARYQTGLRQSGGVIDICKGFGGVLVRPRFFREEAFDIVEPFWAVDDVWISGMLAANGVSIRLLDQGLTSSGTELMGVDPLTQFSLDNRGRKQLDAECVRFFQRNYSIWMS